MDIVDFAAAAAPLAPVGAPANDDGPDVSVAIG